MKNDIECKRILSLLKNGYSDNELAGAALDQVNRHLEKCSACRRAREDLEAIALLLRNAPRANPPESLWARVQKEIRPARSQRMGSAGNLSAGRFEHFFARENMLALAAAAMLVIAAIGFYFGSRRPNNVEFAPSMSSLIGNDEMREPSMNFESNIEKYLL